MRLKSAGKAKRHPLWSQEQFLSDLRKYRSIKKVCELYADETSKWRAYYSDQWRWRKSDPNLDSEVRTILEAEKTDRPENGRPRNDGGDKSWQDNFCEYLISQNWSFEKAASNTPYTTRQIVEFLDSACSSYDQDFARKVEGAEMVLASRAREIIVGEGLDQESYSSFDKAKITQAKLWNAHKALEKLEKRFSKRQLEVTGTIDHRHQVRKLPVEDQFAMLIDDRKRFLKQKSSEVAQLPSGERIELDIEEIEAEIVESED